MNFLVVANCPGSSPRHIATSAVLHCGVGSWHDALASFIEVLFDDSLRSPHWTDTVTPFSNVICKPFKQVAIFDPLSGSIYLP